MTRSHSRSRRSFAIVLFFAWSSASCTTLRHRSYSEGTQIVDADGVTTRSGNEVLFARSSASIKNDTLYALGESGPLKMPTDSIARVSKRKVSVWRSAALAGGIGVVALSALVLLAAKTAVIP